jgi:hypothetical protein
MKFGWIISICNRLIKMEFENNMSIADDMIIHETSDDEITVTDMEADIELTQEDIELTQEDIELTQEADVEEDVINETDADTNSSASLDSQVTSAVSPQKRQHNEYIIAMRTKHTNDKLMVDIAKIGEVTRAELKQYDDVYQKLDTAFVEKFCDSVYFEEYHQLVREAYEMNYSKLFDSYIVYEKSKCTAYVVIMQELIDNDQYLKDILRDWSDNNTHDVYDTFKLYKEGIFTTVKEYADVEMISQENHKFIINSVSQIFENIEEQCNVIIKLNLDYTVKCFEYIRNFTDKMRKCVTKFSFTSFGNEQDEEIEDLSQIIKNVYYNYLSMEIPYNDSVCARNPPQNLRDAYETNIKIVYQNEWLNEIENIRTLKNREHLQKLIAHEPNFVEHQTAKEPQNLMCVNYEHSRDCLYMNRTEIELLLQIIARCKIDVYYVGKLYLILSKNIKLENSMIANCIKELRVNNGTYFRENLPQFLIMNDSITSKLFTTINSCDNKLYILTPTNLEMFFKLTEVIRGLNVRNDVEKYFEIDTNSIKI